ncbi:choice-of-anchor Q domain-containing protein [Leucobacter sp. BZR 635]
MTKSVDDALEGSFSWAVEESLVDEGTSVIEFAPNLVVEVQATETLMGDIVLRSQDPAQPAELVNVSSSGLFVIDGLDAKPVEISNLTLRAGAPEASGVIIRGEMCSVLLDTVTIEGFSDHGVDVIAMSEFESLTVQNSTVRGMKHPLSTRYGAINLDSDHSINPRVRVTGSEFLENEMTGFAAAAPLRGTAERPLSVEFRDSVFRDNTAKGYASAGGVSIAQAELREHTGAGALPEAAFIIDNTTFLRNSAPKTGAFHIETLSKDEEIAGPPTHVSVSNSSFIDNEAEWPDNLESHPAYTSKHITIGEPVIHLSSADFTTLAVANSTFSGVDDGHEGSIGFGWFSGSVELDHVTLVGPGLQFGYVDEETSSVSLRSSVFDTGSASAISARTDFEEELENLRIEDSHSAFTTEAFFAASGADRIVASSAEFQLGDVRFDLGSTPVFLPAETSVLVDKAAHGVLGLDQRGVTRPQGPAPDIGSVEVVPSPIGELGTITMGGDQRTTAGDPMTFTVSRELPENGLTEPARVRVRTADGSAIAGTHYAPLDTILVWEAGDAADKHVTVVSLPAEANTTASSRDFRIEVEIIEDSAVLGARVAATGTIVVEDGTPEKPDPEDGKDPEEIEDPGTDKHPSDDKTDQGLAHSGQSDPLLAWVLGCGLLTVGVAASLTRRQARQ